MVYNVLNKLKWTGKIEDSKIIILHRGAKDDKKKILGKNITEIKKSYFTYKNSEETLIPMHRVLVVKVSGKVVWERVKGSGR